jgi:hypothetical protein
MNAVKVVPAQRLDITIRVDGNDVLIRSAGRTTSAALQ